MDAEGDGARSPRDRSRSMRVCLLDEDFAREGLSRQDPSPREDGRRVPVRPGTFEWWYLDAHLDDGTVVVVNFLTKPMSRIRGGAAPHVKITVTAPDGSERRVEDWVPPGRFRASEDACDVAIGNSTFRGDLRRYEVHAEAGEVVADLALEGVVPPWRPGTGKMIFGEDPGAFFGWMVAVPFGRVSGRLSIGGVAREVSGTGYHDHNYGTVVMSDVCDGWWWSRTQAGDCTVIAVELAGARRYGGTRVPLFLLARGGRHLTDDGSRMALERHDVFVHGPSGKRVEGRLVFRYRDDALDLALELARRKDLYALDLLTYLPAWKAVAARLLGVRPWYLRFLGAARLDLRAGGVAEHRETESVYELMSFR